MRDADCPVFDFVCAVCGFGVAGIEDEEGQLCLAFVVGAGRAFL